MQQHVAVQGSPQDNDVCLCRCLYSYIVMVYVVMASIVMAHAVIYQVYVVMAYTIMVYVVIAYTVMAYAVLAYIVMAMFVHADASTQAKTDVLRTHPHARTHTCISGTASTHTCLAGAAQPRIPLPQHTRSHVYRHVDGHACMGC